MKIHPNYSIIRAGTKFKTLVNEGVIYKVLWVIDDNMEIQWESSGTIQNSQGSVQKAYEYFDDGTWIML